MCPLVHSRFFDFFLSESLRDNIGPFSVFVRLSFFTEKRLRINPFTHGHSDRFISNTKNLYERNGKEGR